MLNIQTDSSFLEKNVPFGVLEICYPPSEQWDLAAFEALKTQELTALRSELAAYDRKTVFGDNPYYRYFKKYKKTYPVMQQLESFLLKGRPFPSGNPINEAVFLLELRTQMLLGTHDIDCIEGTTTLFCPSEKLPFPGLRGDEVHTYPGDVTGRDEQGIIFGMISGADARTCIHPNSSHMAYLFFGTPQTTKEEIKKAQQQLAAYIRVLAPTAEQHTLLL